MRERVPDYDVVASPPGAPLVLSGPPGRLSGRVELHNPGDVRVVLREAKLTDASGALGPRPLRQAFHPVVLRPAQGRSVPLKLAVDPTTPPGEYRCELELAGQSRSVVLHVAEVFDLSVEPELTVVENRPGEVQRKRLIVTNEGNVPFTVGDIGDVGLEDEMIWCRAERRAITPWLDKEDAGLEELIVDVLKAARHEAYRADAMEVRSRAGDVVVAPGETRAIDIDVTVPENLHPNSRYRGVIPLFTVDLEFLVVPIATAPPAAKRAPAKKAPAKKAPAKKTLTKKTPAKKAPAKRQGGRS